jgi:hypothetical protein
MVNRLSPLIIAVAVLLLATPAPSLQINPGGGGDYYPGRPGIVVGHGETKKLAREDALRRMPRGMRAGEPIYRPSAGANATCELHYARRGHVSGRGASKSEAHAEASGRLPRGVTAGTPEYRKEGKLVICKLSYEEKGRVTGRGSTREQAYRDAASRVPRGAEPGKVSYGQGGSQGWRCELPYSL